MEKGQNQSWKKSKLSSLGEVVEVLEEELKQSKSLPLVVQPQTPKEPMEFLSRSWSVSAEEISKALANKQKHYLLDKHLVDNHSFTSESSISSPPHVVEKLKNNPSNRRMGGIGKWFQHHRESSKSNHNSFRRKDRARAENAHMHAALSIASLAAALAAVASSDDSSKMSRAVASATELLASHCIEVAEQAGADHDRVASAVRSAVDIKSPGDLMTLTAAAATALRAESALRARLPKDAKRNAAISPCDKALGDANSVDSYHSETEEPKFPCVGELMQHAKKGNLRWKQVTIYINKKSQVILKLKSKHVGGAFSKKDKCLVYEVCDKISTWPFKQERDNLEAYFGLKTAQGFLEFKCKNKVHKQQWVDGIQSMLDKVGCIEDVENMLQQLKVK